MGDPCNRDLCIKYDVHINVERVVVRSVMKYLYKYVHKGHNPATIKLESGIRHDDSEQHRNNRQRNEIWEYLDSRYVSTIESFWRIFEFGLQHQYPLITKLQYHLHGEH